MQEKEGERAKKIKKTLLATRSIIVIIIITIIFVFVAYNIGNINIDNFRRILAQIDFSINTSSTGGNINLPANQNNTYLPFKGGIAVQTSEGLKIYDRNGNEFKSHNLIYKQPFLKQSKKFLLSCDIGGKTLSITNSFAIVSQMEFEKEIICATISENGAIAVVTGADSYKSKVTVYSADFKEQFYAFFADRYITDVALSADGQTLAIASIVPENGVTNTLISLYRISEKKEFNEIKIKNNIVFDVEYQNADTILAVSNTKAYLYTKTGAAQNTIDFEKGQLADYDISSSKSVFVTSLNSQEVGSTIIISDTKKTVLKYELDVLPISTTLLSGNVAILKNDGIFELKLVKDKIVPEKILEKENDTIKIMGDNNIIYQITNSSIKATEIK